MKQLLVYTIFIFVALFPEAKAQDQAKEGDTVVDYLVNYNYDKDLLSSEFHKGRRQLLRDSMPANSVALFFSSPVRNMSNDVNFEYHQDPNMYYLTGLKEPHALLLVFKQDFQVRDSSTREIIFVQDRNKEKETWHGRRLGKKGAEQLLGIETVLINNDFANFNIDFSQFSSILYYPLMEDVRDDKKERGDLYSLMRHFRRKVDSIKDSGKLNDKRLQTIMQSLREIKTKDELVLMKKAILSTCEAQKELMRALSPGMKEYESEAIVEYIFKKNGAEQPGFPSILGGGENSCILHYTSNRKKLEGNHLLVVDIGAEYHGYTADVTRTMPVDGTFSKEERLIYELVLEAQKAGINASKMGNKFWDPHDAATRVIQKGLMELGIIEKYYQSRDYFMHGTSHYLGLDVHDAGNYGSLKPGNVITVEPGIYIQAGSNCDPKWWNIGVRIEDDVLITRGGPVILSESAPREIEEIEKLMKENSIFNDSK